MCQVRKLSNAAVVILIDHVTSTVAIYRMRDAVRALTTLLPGAAGWAVTVLGPPHAKAVVSKSLSLVGVNVRWAGGAAGSGAGDD